MPRGKVNRRLDDAERIRLFAEYHIEKVRFAKGGISAVKHTAYGWISPQQYYALQKLHDVMPLIREFIEGGYRVNSMVWGFGASFEIAGVGVNVPIGMGLLATAVFNLYQELVAVQAGEPHWERLAYVAYSVFGPFGSILQVLDTIQAVLDPANPLIPAQLKPSAWEALQRKADEIRHTPLPPRPVFR